MKTPICSFDAKSGILCSTCENKVKNGNLTKTDVELSINLTKLLNKVPELNKLEFKKCIEVNEYMILIFNGLNANFNNNIHSFNNKIGQELNKKIWSIEGDLSTRKLIEELFKPIKVLTVNIIWLPDGSEIMKVVLAGWKTKKLPINIDGIIDIISKLKKVNLIVEFEKK